MTTGTSVADRALPDFKYGHTTYTVRRVTFCGNLKYLKPVYLLTGPRGAAYGLIHCLDRDNQPTPQMFAMNMQRATASTPFGGSRFTDEHGPLELLP